ncbi:hypothetical protein RI054_18g83780 [Pseudoscourfieldia marina]
MTTMVMVVVPSASASARNVHLAGSSWRYRRRCHRTQRARESKSSEWVVCNFVIKRKIFFCIWMKKNILKKTNRGLTPLTKRSLKRKKREKKKKITLSR